MAIQPGIALQGRPFDIQMPDPLAAKARVLSVQDAFQRKTMQDQSIEQNKMRLEDDRLKLEETKRIAEDKRDYDEILSGSLKKDDTGQIVYSEDGYPEFDYAGVGKAALAKKKPHLALQFKKEQETLKKQAADTLAAEAKANADMMQVYGDVLSGFEGIPEKEQATLWKPWIESKVKAGQLDPGYAQQLLSRPFSKEMLRGEIDGMIGQKEAAERHLKAEQIRKTAAETAKLEADAAALKTQGYAPGTLVITRDKDGNEVSRFTVPAKEDKPSDKEKETRLVEEAYAQLKLGGKAWDKMTAAEKVAAKRWDEAATSDPTKRTDLDKMMELYRSPKEEDRALFNALKGNFEEGPTVSNKVSILNAIFSASKDRLDRVDPEMFEKNRKLYLQIWPDLPGYNDAQKIIPKPPSPAATPPRAVPTAPPTGKFSVKAPNGKDYPFDTQAQLDAFKAKAGIK